VEHLLIQISNTETGARVEAGFKRSPVRVGRNDLNDLSIDEGFVSQFHGLVRFDGESTFFLDLGSTNGTKLGGNRVEPNLEVPIEADTVLGIGPLRLTCTRMTLSKDQILSRRASGFALGGTNRQGQGVGAGGTVKLGDTQPSSNRSIEQAVTQPRPPPVAPSAMQEAASQQEAMIAEAQPAYDAFVEAYQRLAQTLEGSLATAPTVQDREARVALMQTKFPKAFEPALRGGGVGGGRGAEVPMDEWLDRLAPGVSKQWEDKEAALVRAGAVLEAFASSYVDLDNGQKQVRNELNVEAGSEARSLPKFDGSAEMLAYLLDAHIDVGDRLDELARGFADIALHQLGMINGAVAGSRALLMQMAPHAIGAAKAGAMTKTSFGIADFFWPFAAAGNYYKLAAKHLELVTGTSLNGHLFGSSFARAYYRVTGKHS